MKNIIYERRNTDPLFTILNDIIQRQTIVNKQNEHQRLMEALHSKRIQALRVDNFDLNKITIFTYIYQKNKYLILKYMKSIKIFDEYEDIKNKMHKRPHYGDVEQSIINPYLFKAPNRNASRLLNSSYAQLLTNPSGGDNQTISNDVKLGPDDGTFYSASSPPSDQGGRHQEDQTFIDLY